MNHLIKIKSLYFKTIYLIYKIFRYKFQTKKNNLEETIDFAFQFFSDPIPFWQIRDEIKDLLRKIKEKKIKAALEIGTAGGGSLFLFSQVLPHKSVMISIDLPYGKYGGGYPTSRIPIYKSLAKSKQKIHLIRSDSHLESTYNKVKTIINNKSLDFIFIDGDHSYEGVKKDFETYSQLVKKDGIIAFHDIVPGPVENVGGVPQFWNEIKKKYRFDEFVKDWEQGGYGIGIIYK